MITSYIMIMYFSLGGIQSAAMAHPEFLTKETCEAAKAQVLSALQLKRWNYHYAFMECVKK
jgi:hypothetical protein